MTHAVEKGLPKQHIERAAAARQARVDKGEDVIVGVNKYRLADEDEIDILDIDNAKVRADQIRRIERVKAERDEGRAQTTLAALREGANGDANRLTLCVEAARARSQLGELRWEGRRGGKEGGRKG